MMFLKRIFIFLSFVILFGHIFLFSFHKIFAATFTFTGTPSNITENEEFSINVAIDGLSSGNIYYLRTDFAHVDTHISYFGYTKNNSGSWYNAQPTLDHTQFYKIIMQEDNKWSGSLEAKLDTASTKYKGTGTYNFRVRKYTIGGTPSWADTTVQVAVVASTTPTPTPSFTPTPTLPAVNTPTPTKAPTPTKIPIPTKTPTPFPAKSPTPTLKPTIIFPSPTIEQPTIKEVFPTSVLGESTESVLEDDNDKPIETTRIKETKTDGNQANILARVLVSVGVIFVIASGILVFRNYINSRKNKDSNM